MSLDVSDFLQSNMPITQFKRRSKFENLSSIYKYVFELCHAILYDADCFSLQTLPKETINEKVIRVIPADLDANFTDWCTRARIGSKISTLAFRREITKLGITAKSYTVNKASVRRMMISVDDVLVMFRAELKDPEFSFEQGL